MSPMASGGAIRVQIPEARLKKVRTQRLVRRRRPDCGWRASSPKPWRSLPAVAIGGFIIELKKLRVAIDDVENARLQLGSL